MFSLAENYDNELYNKDVITSLLDNYGDKTELSSQELRRGRSRLENPKVKYLKLLCILVHGHVYFQSSEIWQDKKQKGLN